MLGVVINLNVSQQILHISQFWKINAFYFMIYFRFLPYKGRKVRILKGSRISGGPDIVTFFVTCLTLYVLSFAETPPTCTRMWRVLSLAGVPPKRMGLGPTNSLRLRSLPGTSPTVECPSST